MIRYFLGLSLFAGLMLVACNQSTIVGSEILDDDFVDVSFTDTFSINTLNVEADSARIYPYTNTLFLLGSIDDPVFGRSSTEYYSQIRKLFNIPDMENAVLDSVVLSLGMNPLGFWGDTMAVQTLEVYELGESLVDYDSIYSTQQFQKGQLLGSKTFNPNIADTAAVFFRGDTFYFPNICRVTLDQSFGEKLLSDTMALQNDTLLQDLTNGLAIRSTSSTSSVFAASNSISLDDYTNKVVLYYTLNDSTQMQHALTLGGRKGLYVENDHSGALLDTYLDNPSGSDSLLFLSGMLNNDIILEIPYLDGLEEDRVLINYAELEFFVNYGVGNSPYDRVNQIYAYNLDENGNPRVISDLNISLLQSTTTYFDGTLKEVEEEEGIMLRYRLNVTNELKKRISEGDTDTPIRLIPFLSADRAYRSVLYGPGSSRYPARLKITYTER